MAQKLFRGQGKVFVALVTAGVVGAGKFLGNVTALSLTPEVEKLEHKESTSGKRAVDTTLIVSRKVSMGATLEDFSPETMAIVFQGAQTATVAGTVTGETLPAALVAGDYVALANTDVTTVVIKDSAGVAATLVAGTDYAIESAKHGSIQILNVGTYVQPFKADYGYGASIKTDIMSGGSKTYELRFEGLNTAEDDTPVLVKCRVQLDPGQKLDLIGDAFGSTEMSGDVLFNNGKFAEIINID